MFTSKWCRTRTGAQCAVDSPSCRSSGYQSVQRFPSRNSVAAVSHLLLSIPHLLCAAGGGTRALQRRRRRRRVRIPEVESWFSGAVFFLRTLLFLQRFGVLCSLDPDPLGIHCLKPFKQQQPELQRCGRNQPPTPVRRMGTQAHSGDPRGAASGGQRRCSSVIQQQMLHRHCVAMRVLPLKQRVIPPHSRTIQHADSHRKSRCFRDCGSAYGGRRTAEKRQPVGMWVCACVVVVCVCKGGSF